LLQYDSPNTLKNYKIALRQFFQFIYQSNEDVDILSERYLSEKRDYRKDMLRFNKDMQTRLYRNRHLAPTTRIHRLNVVRAFLEENDITFKKRFFTNLNGKVTEAISEEHTPTSEEIRRIVAYMPIQGKALTLVLASSGMRLDEALRLKLENIDFNYEPVRIRIKSAITKTGKKRYTFLTPEAVDALKEFLAYREQYMQIAAKRSKTRKKTYDTIFPFTDDTFRAMWKTALQKTGLLQYDELTGRMITRPHNLRKYFRLRAGQHGQDEVEAMMGHQQGLNKVYAKFEGEYGEKRLAQVYRKAIPDLSLYQPSMKLASVQQAFFDQNETLNQALEQLKQEKDSQQIALNSLAIENMQIKDKLQQLAASKQTVTALQQDLITQKTLTNRMIAENRTITSAIQAIVKTLLSEYPLINTIHEDEGRLYENKVVGIDLTTGTFKTEYIEITDEDTLKNWDELCDLLDRTPQTLDTILDDHNLNLKLE
jgi:integrase